MRKPNGKKDGDPLAHGMLFYSCVFCESPRMRPLVLLLALTVVGCGSDVSILDSDVSDLARESSAKASLPLSPCMTRISYGSEWIHGAGHPAMFDDAAGRITWDGVCHRDGDNSYAVLSNGWRPYFNGPTSCILALDASSACTGIPSSCTTRISYGTSWLEPAGHTARYDDVAGVVTWDGLCSDASAGQSAAELSNGWTPHFSGSSACAISLRHEQCGGLFSNPVIDVNCPDPGVVYDGKQYVMACTGLTLHTSADLVHWTSAGSIFTSMTRPSWATGDFWAPEIHRVGARWIAYFSARHTDGHLALGAALGDSSTGPFRDIGHPLLRDPTPGVIDVHEFDAPDGTHYLLWKVDGNATGSPTPIYIQPLADDGVTLRGTRTRILVNDRAWEGALVEGPWMIEQGGTFYLFYSGNTYSTPRYAIGVARASSPLGPFTKADEPLLTSNSSFAGPGHGSVVRGPDGEWVQVYHAWLAGHAGSSPGRLVLVDRLSWSGGWPHMFSMPSPRSQPLP